MLAAGNPEMYGTGFLYKYETYEDWIAGLEAFSDRNKIDPSSNSVEGSEYLFVDDERHRLLGMVHMRHYLNDFMLRLGGHIGYSVRPSERKKGYGRLQLKLALEKMSELGVKDVLIVCDSDNAASCKTVESCGGTLENEVFASEYGCYIRRYWIRT
jgi:predicted acetyltransferase